MQVGDLLQPGGLAGVYPPGLPVARVVNGQRRVESGFARIQLQPVASPDGVRQVLVLEPLQNQLPPRPAPAAEAAKPERQINAPGRRGASTP